MPENVNEGIETALNTISSTTEQRVNMKKELKHTKYETKYFEKNIFAKLTDLNDSKTRTISVLETQVTNTKAVFDRVRNRTAMGHGAPCLIPGEI